MKYNNVKIILIVENLKIGGKTFSYKIDSWFWNGTHILLKK